MKNKKEKQQCNGDIIWFKIIVIHFKILNKKTIIIMIKNIRETKQLMFLGEVHLIIICLMKFLKMKNLKYKKDQIRL